MKPRAKPKFCKTRPVPYALKEAIDRELDRLESDLTVNVVLVPKAEGTIRLCGDYKVIINPQLEVDQYLLPKPDDIFATLAEGK